MRLDIRKQIIRVMCLSLVLLLVAMPPTLADTTETINLEIGGGTLDISSSTLDFADITIDYSGEMYSSTTSTITINDSRATGEGWVASYSMSPFEALNIDDPTSSNESDTISVRLKDTEGRLGIQDVLSMEGQDTTKIQVPSDFVYFQANNTPVNILNAEIGGGMGMYMATLNKELFLLGKAEVINKVGTGNLQVGEEIGILKGTYTSTISLTTGSGL